MATALFSVFMLFIKQFSLLCNYLKDSIENKTYYYLQYSSIDNDRIIIMMLLGSILQDLELVASDINLIFIYMYKQNDVVR